MRFSFAVYSVAVVATLCSSVLANVDVIFTVNNVNITATELVTFNSAGQNFLNTTNCVGTCNTVKSSFQACVTDNCICSTTVASQLVECEQCLFAALIQQNVKAPDLRVGSQPVLTAYTAACSSVTNTTFETLSLHPPPNWDGPESLKLSTGTTVIAVGTAFVIASGGIYLLWNLQ